MIFLILTFFIVSFITLNDERKLNRQDENYKHSNEKWCSSLSRLIA